MHIAQLTLSEFRNYEKLRLNLDPEPVVLFGDNGAGKTNLLEAVSLLCAGKGLRGVRYEDLLRQGANNAGWAVASHTVCAAGEVRLGTSWRSGETQTGGSRQVSIDDTVHRSSGALAGYLRAVWLTPAMDRLFTASSSDRRRFLDRIVAAYDDEHGRRISALERLLRERNRLLGDGKWNSSWLDSVELQLAETAVACAAARVQSVDRLAAFITAKAAEKTDHLFPWSRLVLQGELEEKMGQYPAVQIEDEYRKILRDSRPMDQAAGRTLKGPHRSDLMVIHGPKSMPARNCSTGEQKALLVGLMMAHARCLCAEFEGWAPLLLFDEIAAHLDAERRAGLFADIRQLNSQAWLTGTDRALFDAISCHARMLSVKDAKIGRVS